MLLEDVRVNIPSHLLESSKMLMCLLSSVDDLSIARNIALPAPKEWLKAWVACFCSEKKLLRKSVIRDVVNCLLVCFDQTTQLHFC
jgi:hypothetical protein